MRAGSQKSEEVATMLRRKSPLPQSKDLAPAKGDNLAAQLHALGVLLDTHHYTVNGLSILADQNGFVVSGFVVPERGAAYNLVQQTAEISAATVASQMARSRTKG